MAACWVLPPFDVPPLSMTGGDTVPVPSALTWMLRLPTAEPPLSFVSTTCTVYVPAEVGDFQVMSVPVVEDSVPPVADQV
ncbi:hypothetical protein D3C87_2133220 [compost metagenome]